MLQFYVMQTRPYRPTYGAIMGDFTFVISLNDNNKFHATVKRAGAKPFDGTIIELGKNFRHFHDAVKACEKYYHNQEN